MSSYFLLAQLDPQILAESEPLIIGIVWIVAILLITVGAIWKYPQVGSVLQLWAAMGTITGAMVTYFFTREQVQRQESQIKMYQTALQASEREKAEAGEQFLNVAAKIKPDIASPENQKLLETAISAWGKMLREIPVGTTRDHSSPSPQPTVPDKFFDHFKKNTPSPSPQ
jgi:hypothetical protein